MAQFLSWLQLFAMIGGGIAIPLAALVLKMRHNDIRHLTKADHDITERLDKIETLLQVHLQWHIDNH